MKAVLDSKTPKFDVTVLTRHDSSKKPSHPGAKLVPVDYGDHTALVNAIRGMDAIVSLVDGRAAVATDQKLLRAAQDAGVRRIFTSEYTLDVLHPAAMSLLSTGPWPQDMVTFVDGARKFAALADGDGSTSFTTLVSAAIIDMWLEGTFGIFDPKGRAVSLIDCGDHHFTGCSLPFLAACIVAALQIDEGKTKNKRIPVAEVRTTMKEVAKAYEDVTGSSFETNEVDSKDLIAKRDASLEAGQLGPAVFMSIIIGAFDGRGAGDMKDGLDFDGDGHLILKRKTIKELCADAVEKTREA